MLKISNFTKLYDGKPAVEGLDLEVSAGDIYAFIGHNGAGKTTTIKACCGIMNFDEGDILIDGISIKKDPLECKKRIAYIPDNPELYDYLSGVKYLNFVADVFGVGKAEREERIRRYSHGMKQKLAIISAFIHDPKLIIMDEPFVGLDPVASHQLKLLMREHCDKGGAIFFSTQVLEVAEKLCDKVAIIKNGKLVTSGTMSEVKGDASLEAVFLELEGENA